MNGSTVQKKKTGLGGRKALNDISNSGKPSALQPSRKHNTNNVIPIGEDLSVTKKMNVSLGGKAKVSGRKALGDLTNSVKQPFNQQQSLKKKSLVKQAIPIVEDENVPYSIADEGFLHNHEKCIKSQNKSMDMDEFLKIIGLDEDACFQSATAAAHNLPPKKSEDDDVMMLFDIEEICEPVIEDWPGGGHCSPVCGSPISPRVSYMSMKDYDNFPSFTLSESPKRSM
ncbi:uncharacterized protein [Rutidosis leptorrhynchoides]|uniref:uncharacterized protein n=1 Tax=Rutidosis leptorrhynchoides TaxID=125765 RepID=UPI003A98DF3E